MEVDVKLGQIWKTENRLMGIKSLKTKKKCENLKGEPVRNSRATNICLNYLYIRGIDVTIATRLVDSITYRDEAILNI